MASVNAKIPTFAAGVFLDPSVRQINPGAYCKAPKKKTNRRSWVVIAMVSLNKNPAVKANTPDKPTAGTISI